MRVLVTGGAGFIGSVLTPMLLQRGYDVRIVDIGMFGFDTVPARAELIKGDILRFDGDWLSDVDAVVHLAGLSNDPMAAFSPALNYVLNSSGSAIVAEAAKAAGVNRLVYASTCSVYGYSHDVEVDESYEPGPTFPYGLSKLMGEKAVSCLANNEFRPIVFRKGTVVGPSPRIRFDLVTNTMVKSALTEGKIRVHNPSLWRPIIDVRDVSRAYLRALDADLSVAGVFNIASANYTIGRLADDVALALRELGTDVPLDIQRLADLRSYRVSTQKAEDILDFHPTLTTRDTVLGLVDEIQCQGITELDDKRFYNVRQMEANLKAGKLPWLKRFVLQDEPEPASPIATPAN